MSRKQAEALADTWDKLAEAGRNQTINAAQVRRVMAEILENSTGQKLSFHSARGWFEEFIASKKGAMSEPAHKRSQKVLENFAAHLGKRADHPLASITAKDVREFRDSLKAGRAISTVNSILVTCISPAFRAAMLAGHIGMNPCSAVPALLDEEGGGKDVFTAEQIAALLRAADDDWRGMILAGYFTGLRLGDIAKLIAQSVNLDLGILTVTPRKTRHKKTVVVMPIHPQFAEWFRARPATIGKAPIFPALAGLGPGGSAGLSTRFAAIMAKAGVVGRVVRGGEGRRTIRSLSFHSLRHSFISALANAGVAPEVRQMLSGHADEKTHAGYTHHALESLRAALVKVPRLEAM